MIKSNAVILLLLISVPPLYGQVLSTPNGSVSSNGTADEVHVNGQTKLINPSGRTLMIERDDDDPWITFHDPSNYWYSMGIDRSNNGVFILNNGGTLGTYPHFVMNNTGFVGIGSFNPINELDVNGKGRFRRQGSATSGFTIGGDALTLRGWGANNPYIEWLNANSTRQGYLGWNTDRLSLVLENQHNFTIEGGKVGIGLTSPVATVQIRSATNSSSDNTMRLEAPAIGSSVSHIHHGVKGDWYIRSANNAGKVVIQDYSGGYVGIGTDAPQAKLHISGGDVLLQNSTSGYPSMYFKDVSGSNTLRFDYNSIIHEGGHLFIRAGESNNLLLNDTGTGNVGIGTQSPTEKLTVNGTVYAKEIKVDLSVPGPDYVFEKDYSLISLEELTKFIEQNKHLPGVPNAKDMETEGIEVGTMNMILLRKIEELTLYVIQLRAESQRQSEVIQQLKKP